MVESIQRLLGSLCLAIAGAVFSQTAVAAPVVHLRFDDNLNDSGAAGITGITKGAKVDYNAAFPPNAGSGKSVLYNPASDTDSGAVVTIPDNADLNVESFTITGWIRPENRGLVGSGTALYSRSIAFSQGIFIGTSWYFGDSAHAKLRLIVNIDNSSQFTDTAPDYASSTSPIVTLNNDWVFVAFSYDHTTSTGKTYFSINDGASQQYGNTVFGTVGAPNAVALPGQIGLRYDGTRAMDGLLDDFRIYGSALGAEDIEQVRLSIVPEPAGAGLLVMTGLALLYRRH